MKKGTKQVLATAVAACALFALSDRAVAAPLAYSGGDYVEHFDTLPTNFNATSPAPGPYDVPSLAGWSYAQLTPDTGTIGFLANDGSSTALGLAGSFGATGIAERALGSAATTPSTPNFGVQLINNTGGVLDQLTLSYTGEMWRRGSATAGSGFLTVSYSTSATDIRNGTFTDIAQLRFNSPNSTAANGPVDGNAAGNRTNLTFTLASGFTWNPSATLTIRWNDFNETSGSDDWLAVDDLTFSAKKAKHLVWNTANATGTWDTNTANKPWLDSAAPSHFTTNDPVALADTPGDIDITVDAAGVAPIAFDVNHAAHKYSLSGGAITAPLTKSNGGTLVLKSVNAFTSTSISGGTVETQVDGAMGTVNINLSNGAIWKTTTNAQTAAANNTVNITGSATIYTETDLNMVHSINGANVIFTKDGPGLLWARHNFPLTGNSEVHVDAGTLRDSDDLTNFGDGIPDNVILRIAAGATFDESYGNGEQFSALSGAGTYLGHRVANGSGHISLLNNTATTFTFSGLITAGTNGVVGTDIAGREILALRKNGIHTAVLTNPLNDFAGPVQINAGVLEIPHIANRGQTSPIGVGNIGPQIGASAPDITFGSATGTTPATAGTLRYTGPNAASDRTITINPGGGVIEVTQPTSVLTLSGAINGSSTPIQKIGPGTLILSGDNTFTGGLDINAGTVLANNSAGSATGDGLVSVNDSGTFGGTGIASTIIVRSGGTLSPGASIGTLNTLSAYFDGGAKLHWELDSSSNTADLLNINGSFNIQGPSTFDLVDLGSPAARTFTLVKYTGFVSGFDQLSLGALPNPQLTYTLVDNQANQSIDLSVTGSADFPQWETDANSSWGDANNWTDHLVPNSLNHVASFLGKITAPRTVTLDGNRAVGQITFDNANRYTIAQGTGGTLTVGSAGGVNNSIDVTGSHTISAPLTLVGTVMKTGPGTLTISGPQAHAANATLVVNRGTLNLDSDAGAAASAGAAANAPLTLNIVGNTSGANAVVKLGSSQNLRGLNLQNADAGNQTLDLNSAVGAGNFRSVRIYAGGDLDALKRSLYQAIRNGGGGDGIIDSGLHANSGIGIGKVADAHGDFHVLIRPTRIGDVNLDGSVTIADFIDLASHFNTSGPTITWQEGDVNKDGSVTIADFIELASNFNQTYSGEVWPVSDSDAKTLTDFAASHGAGVPEPGIAAIAMGATGLIWRRRRR